MLRPQHFQISPEQFKEDKFVEITPAVHSKSRLLADPIPVIGVFVPDILLIGRSPAKGFVATNFEVDGKVHEYLKAEKDELMETCLSEIGVFTVRLGERSIDLKKLKICLRVLHTQMALWYPVNHITRLSLADAPSTTFSNISSSKNHCIKTLNTFLDYLKKKNLVDPSNVYKMGSFPTHLVGARNAEHLISPEEFKVVHGLLKETSDLVATFFETAYWSAMRFNEIFGLSIDDIFIGELEEQVLKPALKDHGIDYYGYIVLESQPATKIRERLKDGSIKRKPLKGKPKIDSKYNRLIPIISKELFNNLVKLYKIQEDKFKRKVYGPNPKDYVLFEDLTYSETVIALREAYARTNFKRKSYHCCRHTRCTELVGATRDFVLARYWLGHARQETTLRYTHIYQQSANTARKKNQKIEFLE